MKKICCSVIIVTIIMFSTNFQKVEASFVIFNSDGFINTNNINSLVKCPYSKSETKSFSTQGVTFYYYWECTSSVIDPSWTMYIKHDGKGTYKIHYTKVKYSSSSGRYEFSGMMYAKTTYGIFIGGELATQEPTVRINKVEFSH